MNNTEALEDAGKHKQPQAHGLHFPRVSSHGLLLQKESFCSSGSAVLLLTQRSRDWSCWWDKNLLQPCPVLRVTNVPSWTTYIFKHLKKIKTNIEVANVGNFTLIRDSGFLSHPTAVWHQLSPGVCYIWECPEFMGHQEHADHTE